MTSYTWFSLSAGGDFGDSNDWVDGQNHKTGQGVPGPLDSATIDTTGVVVADDQVVEDLAAGSSVIDGNLTVTGKIDGGVLKDGADHLGLGQAVSFDGGTLTADVLEQGSDLIAGKVAAHLMIDDDVSGATVKAAIVGRGPTGGKYLGASETVVESGSLVAKVLRLAGVTAAIKTADVFSMFGGSTTITGPASATGAGTAIKFELGLSEPLATMDFEQTLTLSDGASFENLEAGKAKAKTIVAASQGAALIDLVGNGASLTVTGSLSLGKGGAGRLDVVEGGALTVDGATVIGGGPSLSAASGNVVVGAGSEVNLGKTTVKSSGDVLTGGNLTIGGALKGDGAIGISAGGSLTLDGSDAAVNLIFEPGNSRQELSVQADHLPAVQIQGFGVDDLVVIGGLSASATVSFGSGAGFLSATFTQAGKDLGTLDFAEAVGGNLHYGDSTLTFTA